MNAIYNLNSFTDQLLQKSRVENLPLKEDPDPKTEVDNTSVEKVSNVLIGLNILLIIFVKKAKNRFREPCRRTEAR
jgi:hypothetical protein